MSRARKPSVVIDVGDYPDFEKIDVVGIELVEWNVEDGVPAIDPHGAFTGVDPQGYVVTFHVWGARAIMLRAALPENRPPGSIQPIVHALVEAWQITERE